MRQNKVRLFLICLILFLIQPAIERTISWFKYYDESIVLVFFILRFLRTPHLKLKKTDSALLMGLSLLMIIGLIGNTRSESGQPVAAIVQDILSNAKLVLFVIGIHQIGLAGNQIDLFKDRLALVMRVLFILMFVTGVISLFADIGMSYRTRYGLPAFKFIYNNPAGLNTYCYLFMILHSVSLEKKGKLRPRSNIYTAMALVVWVMTLRSRAFAFGIIYLVLYIHIFFLRKHFRFRWYQAILASGGAVVIGWSAIKKYFIQNSMTARSQLLRGSITLARDFFPVGTGFGTFGSEASRDYYSRIYTKYNMSGITGLSPQDSRYVTDQYWFGILGQFGILGSIIMAGMIFLIYKEIWSFSRFDRGKQLAALTLFFTSILASITAGTFIQASILPSVLVFYLLRGKDCQRQNLIPVLTTIKE